MEYQGFEDENGEPVYYSIATFQREKDAYLFVATSDLFEACLAAQRYDASILGKCARGETKPDETGLGFSDAEDLDALYTDWMTKAHAAVAKARGGKGHGTG
jgi:hypothetical protein